MLPFLPVARSPLSPTTSLTVRTPPPPPPLVPNAVSFPQAAQLAKNELARVALDNAAIHAAVNKQRAAMDEESAKAKAALVQLASKGAALAAANERLSEELRATTTCRDETAALLEAAADREKAVAVQATAVEARLKADLEAATTNERREREAMTKDLATQLSQHRAAQKVAAAWKEATSAKLAAEQEASKAAAAAKEVAAGKLQAAERALNQHIAASSAALTEKEQQANKLNEMIASAAEQRGIASRAAAGKLQAERQLAKVTLTLNTTLENASKAAHLAQLTTTRIKKEAGEQSALAQQNLQQQGASAMQQARSELARVENKLAATEDALTGATKAAHSAAADARDRARKMEADIESAKARAAAAASAATTSESRAALFKSELDKGMHQLDNLRARLADAVSTPRRELVEIEQFRIENAELKTQAAHAKSQIEFLQDTVARECDEREALKEQLASAVGGGHGVGGGRSGSGRGHGRRKSGNDGDRGGGSQLGPRGGSGAGAGLGGRARPARPARTHGNGSSGSSGWSSNNMRRPPYAMPGHSGGASSERGSRSLKLPEVARSGGGVAVGTTTVGSRLRHKEFG